MMEGQEPTEASVSIRETDMLTTIARILENPAMDPDKISKLLDIQMRLLDDQRRQQYADAMNRLQASIPQIDKSCFIQDNSGKIRNKFAKYEDIDEAVRPMISEEGFAVTFNEEEVRNNERKYSCTFLHRAGHSETKAITLPLDSSGSKNSIQGAGSTFSYARRYLLKAFLNLVEKDEDDDGNGGSVPLTEEQVRDLNTLFIDATARFDEAKRE